jgi:hypothetical protein
MTLAHDTRVRQGRSQMASGDQTQPASQCLTPAIYAAAVKLFQAVQSYERAETEVRRADNACTQPRMQKAGNRLFMARIRMSSAARDFANAKEAPNATAPSGSQRCGHDRSNLLQR